MSAPRHGLAGDLAVTLREIGKVRSANMAKKTKSNEPTFRGVWKAVAERQRFALEILNAFGATSAINLSVAVSNLRAAGASKAEVIEGVRALLGLDPKPPKTK